MCHWHFQDVQWTSMDQESRSTGFWSPGVIWWTRDERLTALHRQRSWTAPLRPGEAMATTVLGIVLQRWRTEHFAVVKRAAGSLIPVRLLQGFWGRWRSHHLYLRQASTCFNLKQALASTTPQWAFHLFGFRVARPGWVVSAVVTYTKVARTKAM